MSESAQKAKFEFLQKLIWPGTLLCGVGILAVTGYNPIQGLLVENPSTQASIPAQTAAQPAKNTNLTQQEMIDQAVAKIAQQMRGQNGLLQTQQARTTGAASRAITPPRQSVTQGDSTFEVTDEKQVQDIVTILTKLKSAKDNAGAKEVAAFDQAYVFFDPRCPYCHDAWDKMKGKVPATWIPVALLGNPEDGNRKVRAVMRGKDSTTLDRVFSNAELSAAEIAEDPQLASATTEIIEVFGTIVSKIPGQQAAVPMILIPRRDGGMTIHVGFNDGDEAKISALLTAG